MKLKQQQLIRAITHLFQLLSDGKSDQEAADEIGIDVEALDLLKRKMFEFKSEEFKQQPVEHVYVQYVIRQLTNVYDLTKLIEMYKLDIKQINAMVGAIRTRGEIWNQLITRGQECGVIQKVPDRKETLLGVVVADLTDKKLKRMMTKELGKLNQLVGANGEMDFLDVPKPTAIYTGPSVDLGVEPKKQEVAEKKKKKKKIKRKKVIDGKKS